MSHPIVDTKPEMLGFAERRAKAKADAEAWREKNEKQQEAFQAASLAALEKGTTIPEAPQNPNAWRNVLDMSLSQIANDEKAWKVRHAEELVTEILDREHEIVAQVAGMLVELDGLVGEVSSMRATLMDLYRAQHGTGVPQCSGTNLELLLASARRGTRMLQEPFTPQRPGIDKPVHREAAPERRQASITGGSVWDRVGSR